MSRTVAVALPVPRLGLLTYAVPDGVTLAPASASACRWAGARRPDSWSHSIRRSTPASTPRT